jgi:hypothetical protein
MSFAKLSLWLATRPTPTCIEAVIVDAHVLRVF